MCHRTWHSGFPWLERWGGDLDIAVVMTRLTIWYDAQTGTCIAGCQRCLCISEGEGAERGNKDTDWVLSETVSNQHSALPLMAMLERMDSFKGYQLIGQAITSEDEASAGAALGASVTDNRAVSLEWLLLSLDWSESRGSFLWDLLEDNPLNTLW